MRAVRQKQSKWHSEMYGYVFAAGEVGVTHHVRRDVMLYPGYQPFLGRGPKILHYGSDYTTADGIYFNKMSHTELKIETCPNFLFGAPSEHAPRTAQSRGARRRARRALLRAPRDPGRGAVPLLPRARALRARPTPAPCAHPDGEASFRRVARDSHAVLDECANEHDNCPAWAKAGECTNNPAFMHSSCAASCGSCEMTTDAILRMFGDDVYHLALALAAASSSSSSRRSSSSSRGSTTTTTRGAGTRRRRRRRRRHRRRRCSPHMTTSHCPRGAPWPARPAAPAPSPTGAAAAPPRSSIGGCGPRSMPSPKSPWAAHRRRRRGPTTRRPTWAAPTTKWAAAEGCGGPSFGPPPRATRTANGEIEPSERQWGYPARRRRAATSRRPSAARLSRWGSAQRSSRWPSPSARSAAASASRRPRRSRVRTAASRRRARPRTTTSPGTATTRRTRARAAARARGGRPRAPLFIRRRRPRRHRLLLREAAQPADAVAEAAEAAGQVRGVAPEILRLGGMCRECLCLSSGSGCGMRAFAPVLSHRLSEA